MNIAFCINRLALIGLGVTVSSLIRNCSDCSKLKLWFLCVGFTGKEKSHIGRLLKSENFLGDFEFIDFNPVVVFGSFCSLHGDWTPYGRLLLSDYINEDQVLYLDSDLVVELDVLQVSNFDFGGHFLAAVGGGRIKYTLGKNFYIHKVGLPPDLEYFNSGVLLLNLCNWREKHIKEECLSIAKRYPMELPSHDQSILNILCKGDFAKLPPAFNCEWCGYNQKPHVSSRMIFHFTGSPKPWDPLGSRIHKGYTTWRQYLDSEWAITYDHLTLAGINRAWKVRRSYMRSIKYKILG